MRYLSIVTLLLSLFLLITGTTVVQAQQDGSDVTPPAPAVEQKFGFTDNQLEHALNTRLQRVNDLHGTNISVKVIAGTATLSGTVPSLVDKYAAEAIASETRGVLLVENTIAVLPASSATPQSLKDNLELALRQNSMVDADNIKVSTGTGGVVTLRGSVASRSHQQSAIAAVAGVAGVTDIRNELTIDSGAQRSAQQIRQDVERRMKFDRRVDAGNLNVEVEGSMVVLSGKVGSSFEREQAIENAYVAGVSKVTADRLNVDPNLPANRWSQRDNRPTAQQITVAVEDNLRWNRSFDSDELSVQVDGGTVTLKGTVPSAAARRAAADAAANTFGVSAVNNQLKIAQQSDADKAGLEQRIKKALSVSPYSGANDLEVIVEGNEVILSGDVSASTRNWAVARIEAMPGVSEVRDETSVQRGKVAGYTGSRADGEPKLNPGPVGPFPDNKPIAEPYTDKMKKDDAEIENMIEAQIFFSPYVGSHEVHVEVLQGVAYLTGTVDSIVEMEKAIENAYEGGARHVVNNIEVEGLDRD